MGNFYSTVSEDAKTFKDLTDENEPRTPQTASNNAKVHMAAKGLEAFIDPRSPTQGVSRTPLEIEEKNRRIEKARVTNLFNKENNLEAIKSSATTNEGDVLTPTTNPKSSKPGFDFFDPRSPNPEINRTPIAVTKSGVDTPVAKKMLQKHNDNEH